MRVLPSCSCREGWKSAKSVYSYPAVSAVILNERTQTSGVLALLEAVVLQGMEAGRQLDLRVEGDSDGHGVT